MTSHTPPANRRQFLKTGAAGAMSASLSAAAAPAAGLHAAGSDTLTLALVGCGGRGTGAARNALDADPGTTLVAMADVFEDHLASSHRNLSKQLPDRIDVPEERRFVGFDAYEKAIDAADVVLLCTPPHFRPTQLSAAVDAGKHVFCEKPVAVDGPGARVVADASARASQRGLSLVSGLCWRYHPVITAAFDQLESGAIGEVVGARASYFARGLWSFERQEGWSDMEYQLRNWLYYPWLSGDHIAEQHVHSLDKITWAMGGAAPLGATGTGGRLTRTAPIYGSVFDHFAIEYEYADDVTAFGRCRQQDGCAVDVTDTVYGTKGTLHIASARAWITGETPWRPTVKSGNMYQLEHEALFRSIRGGEARNDGDYMTTSTRLALLGRTAAYTGREVTWEEVRDSDVSLGPSNYEWGSVDVPPVPQPGLA